MNRQIYIGLFLIISIAVIVSGCEKAPAVTSNSDGLKLSVAPLITVSPVLNQNQSSKPNPSENIASSQVVQTATQQPVSTMPEATTRVDTTYFDDAVFVGDSVSLKLSYYNLESAALGQAQFLTSGSLGSANALWDVSDKSVHPSYQGEKMRIEDAVAYTGAKKLYIMLGMNDVGLYGPQDSQKNLIKLIELIEEKSPGLIVYVQSVTPMTSTSTLKALTNEKIVQYNQLVQEACEQCGWNYLNVASIFVDPDGYLPRDYCSDPDDMGIHFTKQACEKWVEYLKNHIEP